MLQVGQRHWYCHVTAQSSHTLGVGHAFTQKQDQNSSPATTAGRILQLPATANFFCSDLAGWCVWVFHIQHLTQLCVLAFSLGVFLYVFVFWLWCFWLQRLHKTVPVTRLCLPKELCSAVRWRRNPTGSHQAIFSKPSSLEQHAPFFDNPDCSSLLPHPEPNMPLHPSCVH